MLVQIQPSRAFNLDVGGDILFPVVPLCKSQLLDVKPEDILEGGLYRKCNTYYSGGGYDNFPIICEKRLGKRVSNQFVVQLRDCVFMCPYCYVTPEGIWSPPVHKTAEELVEAFLRSGQEIFHLMGGAPALYLDQWPDILDILPSEYVFHSDFLLAERLYTMDELEKINRENTLYAVSLKGVDQKSYIKNTMFINTPHFYRKDILTAYKQVEDRIFLNLEMLKDSGVNFYITLTGSYKEKREWELIDEIRRQFGDKILEDFYRIDIIKYRALAHREELTSVGCEA